MSSTFKTSPMRAIRVAVTIATSIGIAVACSSADRTGVGRDAPAHRATGLAADSYRDRDEWYLWADGNCRLYVAELGRGQPVVVLHGGWGAEHGYLVDALEGLADRYRLIFYDQRGSLRSPCPPRAISLDAHLEDLERLRTELRLDGLRIVGHSTGAYLAASYLERHPDRVRNLVLLAPPPLRSPTGDETRLARDQKEAAEAFLKRPEIDREIAEEGLDRESLSGREESYRWRIRFAAVNVYHVDRWRRVRGGEAFFEEAADLATRKSLPAAFDLIDDLRAHPYPVTVISGDHDFTDLGARLLREQLAAAPNVELVMIDDAGHHAWIDRPAEFRRRLGEALANR